MILETDHFELVKKAQRGDRECLNRLGDLAREPLHKYVQRLTLREDLTQDIVQESILEMYKVFDKLKQIDRFWSWLYGIAFNKVRSHYGKLWRQKTVPLPEGANEIAETNCSDGLADMITAEWKQIVVKSMRELQPRHRADKNIISILTCRVNPRNWRDFIETETQRPIGRLWVG